MGSIYERSVFLWDSCSGKYKSLRSDISERGGGGGGGGGRWVNNTKGTLVASAPLKAFMSLLWS